MVSGKKVIFIDLNAILMAFNFILFLLSICAFFFAVENEYINQHTFLFGILLCVETQSALFLERRRRDPLMLILSYITIFYYSMRILTLALYPFSSVFLRFPSSVHPGTFNESVLFIIIANIFLYAGLLAKKSKGDTGTETGNWRAASTWRTVFILSAGIIVSYADSTLLSVVTFGRMFAFLIIFINKSTVIMMVFIYIYVFRESIPRRSYVVLVTLILGEMVLHSLVGSRAAILSLIQNIILVNFAVYGRMRFRTWQVGLGLAALPFAVVLMALIFTMSSHIRSNKDGDSQRFNIGRAMDLAVESLSGGDNALKTLELGGAFLLPPFFERLGYLDFSTEIISNRDRYAAVINMPAYARSLTDNLFTPGFDVFDQARISYSLQFVYNPNFSGPPLKSRVEEHYQSDQLGLYAELYVLFGEYFSLPLFFIIGLLAKWIYVSLKSPNPLILALKKNVVYIAFFMTINSFGLDWMMIETVPIAASIFIYKFFFHSCQRVPAQRIGSVPNPIYAVSTR
jgi:hypothetical protein